MSGSVFKNAQHHMQGQWEMLQQKVMLAWESHLAPKYRGLEEREQRIVLFAVIILPLMILVFGILLPAADKTTALQADIKAFASQVNEAKRLAQQLEASPQTAKSGKPSSNDMLTQVDKIARQTGVRSFMTRLRPQQVMGAEPRLQAQMKSAPYVKVVSFLARLAQHNLAVRQIKIQATSSGLVHVQAVIGG